MLATTPEEFLRAFGDGRALPSDRPVTMRAALVVTPVGFRVSEESATDNRYMRPGSPVDVPRALATLERAVSGGWFCHATVAREPWLECVRETPRFGALVAEAKTRQRRAAVAFLEAGGDQLLGLSAEAVLDASDPRPPDLSD